MGIHLAACVKGREKAVKRNFLNLPQELEPTSVHTVMGSGLYTNVGQWCWGGVSQLSGR